jgi:hypothetical protein
MSNNLINNNNSLARAAERVRAKRAAERTSGVAEPIATEVVKTTTQVRAPLNDIPDSMTLSSRINNALAALSRGIRWARGSILNLLV